jgi:hypothetical protein
MAYPQVFHRTLAASSGPIVTFGFNAATLWLRNDCTGSIWFTFTSGAATTGTTSLELKSSESFGPLDVYALAGLSAVATSTALFRVLARGW